jgi:hypothetical protein
MKPGAMLRFLIPILGLAGLAACGPAMPPPTEQLALTEAAVNKATASEGYKYAPVELKNAQEKLTQARMDMQNEKNASALRLLEQAEVDARLAAEKAQTAKTERAVLELQKNIELLREEMRRSVPKPNNSP